MHSFIIYSGSQVDREEMILKQLNILSADAFSDISSIDGLNHPNVFKVIPDRIISIAQIRNLKHSLLLKPYNVGFKIVIILSAELLSLPAQNSLLKILEEPTTDTYIFLELENYHSLLSTIISRCQLIKINIQPKISQDLHRNAKDLLDKLMHSTLGQRMQLVNKITDRQQSIALLTVMLISHKYQISDQPQMVYNLKLIQQILQDIQNNTNLTLSLEHLVLNLEPKPQILP